MTKAQVAAQQEARDKLRTGWAAVSPGDRLFTVLRHRSASGMTRSIDVYKLLADRDGRGPDRMCLSWLAKEALGWSWDTRREAVRVGGAGMDMGFHLVYSLSRTLFPDGFGCIGHGCPSNDHSNGDRDYTPYFHRDIPKPDDGVTYSATHWHTDGGYALRQEWL